MSISFSIISAITGLTAVKSVILFETGSPYKSVNWMILGLCTQIIGALFFGSTPIVFLTLGYLALLIHLNRSLVPNLTLKDQDDDQTLFQGSRGEIYWTFAATACAFAGAACLLLPYHQANLLAPWFSVFALLSSKASLVTRQITKFHYFAITVLSLGSLFGSLIASSIPGLLVMECLLALRIYQARQDILIDIPILEDKVTNHEPSSEWPLSEEDMTPVVPTRSFNKDREPLMDEGVPIESVIPDEDRVRPLTASGKDSMIAPSKVLKEHQRSERIVPDIDPHDEFFPKPEDVPYHFDLPKSPLASLGHAVAGLFKSRNEPKMNRVEPSLNE